MKQGGVQRHKDKDQLKRFDAEYWEWDANRDKYQHIYANDANTTWTVWIKPRKLRQCGVKTLAEAVIVRDKMMGDNA